MLKRKFFIINILFLFSFLINGRVPISDSIEYAKNNLVGDKNKNRIEVLYFLPNDIINIKKILLGLIYNEKKSIDIAQFIINDKDIAQALCDAFDRGVIIKGIVDNGNLGHNNQKVTMLQEKGMDIILYRKPYSIMHLKSFLFGENFFGKEILWLGSANSTFSAYKKNQEFVSVFDNQQFIKQFKEKFKSLYQEVSAQQKEKDREKYNITFRELWKLVDKKFMVKKWLTSVHKK